MDIREMRYFYAVVEEGNISSASKRLSIAQPALSRQIKQLEDSLGVRLFERGSRRIRLTEAGQLLRERVEQILGLVDGTMKEMAEFNSGSGGTISIGTVTTSGALLLPTLINEFHRLYPNVTFHLWEGDGYRILELLDKGVIEVGIIRAPFDPELYESITLPDEPLAIAMKKDGCTCGQHPHHIRLSELADQSLIVPLRWQSRFIEWCEKAGFKPKIICISDSIFLSIIWAKLGIGMALVPRSTEGFISDTALTYKTIIEPAVSTQTVIVWLRNRKLSASSKHLLALLRQAGKEGLDPGK